MSDRTPFPELEPRLIRRECGGWLAVSPDRAKVRIGVEGKTEEEAWRNWKTAARAWQRLFDLEPAIDISGLRDETPTTTRRFRRKPKARRNVEWLRKKYLKREAIRGA